MNFSKIFFPYKNITNRAGRVQIDLKGVSLYYLRGRPDHGWGQRTFGHANFIIIYILVVYIYISVALVNKEFFPSRQRDIAERSDCIR